MACFCYVRIEGLCFILLIYDNALFCIVVSVTTVISFCKSGVTFYELSFSALEIKCVSFLNR